MRGPFVTLGQDMTLVQHPCGWERGWIAACFDEVETTQAAFVAARIKA